MNSTTVNTERLYSFLRSLKLVLRNIDDEYFISIDTARICFIFICMNVIIGATLAFLFGQRSAQEENKLESKLRFSYSTTSSDRSDSDKEDEHPRSASSSAESKPDAKLNKSQNRSDDGFSREEPPSSRVNRTDFAVRYPNFEPVMTDVTMEPRRSELGNKIESGKHSPRRRRRNESHNGPDGSRTDQRQKETKMVRQTSENTGQSCSRAAEEKAISGAAVRSKLASKQENPSSASEDVIQEDDCCSKRHVERQQELGKMDRVARVDTGNSDHLTIESIDPWKNPEDALGSSDTSDNRADNRLQYRSSTKIKSPSAGTTRKHTQRTGVRVPDTLEPSKVVETTFKPQSPVSNVHQSKMTAITPKDEKKKKIARTGQILPTRGDEASGAKDQSNKDKVAPKPIPIESSSNYQDASLESVEIDLSNIDESFEPKRPYSPDIALTTYNNRTQRESSPRKSNQTDRTHQAAYAERSESQQSHGEAVRKDDERAKPETCIDPLIRIPKAEPFDRAFSRRSYVDIFRDHNYDLTDAVSLPMMEDRVQSIRRFRTNADNKINRIDHSDGKERTSRSRNRSSDGQLYSIRDTKASGHHSSLTKSTFALLPPYDVRRSKEKFREVDIDFHSPTVDGFLGKARQRGKGSRVPVVGAARNPQDKSLIIDGIDWSRKAREEPDIVPPAHPQHEHSYQVLDQTSSRTAEEQAVRELTKRMEKGMYDSNKKSS